MARNAWMHGSVRPEYAFTVHMSALRHSTPALHAGGSCLVQLSAHRPASRAGAPWCAHMSAHSTPCACVLCKAARRRAALPSPPPQAHHGHGQEDDQAGARGGGGGARPRAQGAAEGAGRRGGAGGRRGRGTAEGEGGGRGRGREQGGMGCALLLAFRMQCYWGRRWAMGTRSDCSTGTTFDTSLHVWGPFPALVGASTGKQRALRCILPGAAAPPAATLPATPCRASRPPSPLPPRSRR